MRQSDNIKIDGFQLTKTPAEMATNLLQQALEVLDINFDEFMERAQQMSPAQILKTADMMKRSAELMEAAAVLKTVTGMPTTCPNCGVNLLQYIRDNEVW